MELGSFGGDGRGQSATIGVALLLGIAVVGTVAIVALGASAMGDTQRQSELERAEHTMTQFDSQASLVALGRAESRSATFSQSDGTYTVDPSAGEIEIVHANFNGTNDDGDDVPDGSDDVSIYKGTLGAVVYKNGDTSIAYQGGGVWRQGGSGEARMVSPPEFHFRRSTLTLPVVQLGGEASASGRVTATTTTGPTTRVYPDASTTYPSSSLRFLNPAEEGQVYVNVTSEYYEGWADYFDERTDGEIETFPDQNKVKVKLISTGVTGAFQMPGEGGSITIRGVEDHSMSEFDITVVPDDTDSADFSNLQWSMHAEDGDEQFELHLRHETGHDCDNTVVQATIYYSPSDGDADDDDPYHGWHSDTAYETECYDADGDGSDDEVRLVADFVDDEDGDDGPHDVEGGDPALEYTSLSSSDVVHFNPSGDPLIDTASDPTFDGHSFSPNWEPQTYNSGDTETIDRLVNHYFSELGPGFDLTVDDKDSNTVTEEKSGGFIMYPGARQFITYLHVTENEVTVEFG